MAVMAKILSLAAASTIHFASQEEKTKKHSLLPLAGIYRSNILAYQTCGRNGDRNNFVFTRASDDAVNERKKDACENCMWKERNGDVFVGGKSSIIASTMRCIIEDRGFMYQR
jgi:hypothetical protein